MISNNSAWGLIRSRDFTQNKNVNLEHAKLILEHYKTNESDINKNAEIFNSFGFAKEYLDIKYLDIITGNGDRHSRNYGILRNRDNGEIVGLAPNYDNNFAFTQDLSMTAFSEVAKQYGYNPNKLSDKDSLELKEEMKTIGFDVSQQINEIGWKQSSICDNVKSSIEVSTFRDIWVRPHFRKGKPVKGHWRKRAIR